MPPDLLPTLHSIPIITSIAKTSDATTIDIMCCEAAKPFLSPLGNVRTIYDYDPADFALGSLSYTALRRSIKETFYDVCLILSQDANNEHPLICAQSGAALRVGFYGSSAYPFVNLSAKALTAHATPTLKNTFLLSILGIKLHHETRFIVDKKSHDDIDHACIEAGINKKEPLLGIDFNYLETIIGHDSAVKLATYLALGWSGTTYLYLNDSADHERHATTLGGHSFSVFASLPVSRMASLIDRSALIVSGATPFFITANLLGKKAIGLFIDASNSSHEADTPTQVSIFLDQVGVSNLPDAIRKALKQIGLSPLRESDS